CVNCLALFCEPLLRSLNDDVLDFDACVDRAVSLRPAHALPALLLEHPNLRSTRLAFDDCDDLRVGDKRRACEHLTAVLFDQQYSAERDFRAGISGRPVDRHDAAWRHAHLAPTGLDDCVHICTYPKPLSYSEKGSGPKAQEG